MMMPKLSIMPTFTDLQENQRKRVINDTNNRSGPGERDDNKQQHRESKSQEGERVTERARIEREKGLQREQESRGRKG